MTKFTNIPFKQTMHITCATEYNKYPVRVHMQQKYGDPWTESFSIEDTEIMITFLQEAVEKAKLLVKTEDDDDD